MGLKEGNEHVRTGATFGSLHNYRDQLKRLSLFGDWIVVISEEVLQYAAVLYCDESSPALDDRNVNAHRVNSLYRRGVGFPSLTDQPVGTIIFRQLDSVELQHPGRDGVSCAGKTDEVV